MAYPKIKPKKSYHYIVVGRDGYRSDSDDDTFRTKRDAERHAGECDMTTPEAKPHKPVKLTTLTTAEEVS